jgi:LysM repeat protein
MPYPKPLLHGAILSLFVAACGSPPPPPSAPEPDPLEEELVLDEAETEPASSILIEARVREPFGVQSAGRPPARAPRADPVVVEADDRPRDPGSAMPDRRDDPDPRPDPDPDTDDEDPAEEISTFGPVGATIPADAVARDPAPTSPLARADDPRTHTVLSGETFYAIARRYDVSPMALAAANAGVDIHRIRPGQVLRLPASGAPAPAAVRTHRVQPGETLWSISRRYDVPVTMLRQANQLGDDTVRIGETLVIP